MKGGEGMTRKRNRKSKDKPGREQKKLKQNVQNKHTEPSPGDSWLKDWDCEYRAKSGVFYVRNADKCDKRGPLFHELDDHRHKKKTAHRYGTTGSAGGTHEYGAYGAAHRSCSHWRQAVALGNGLPLVYASGWSDSPSSWWSDEETPEKSGVLTDIGFYCDNLWINRKPVFSGLSKPWGEPLAKQYIHYPWPDMSIPASLGEFYGAATWLLGEVEGGKTLDIGCYGGHGRTGTAMACLMVLQGAMPGAAVKRIRETYCKEAVETREQVAFVLAFYKWHMRKLRLMGTEMGEDKHPEDDLDLLEAEAKKCWKGSGSYNTNSSIDPDSYSSSYDPDRLLAFKDDLEDDLTDSIDKRLPDGMSMVSLTPPGGWCIGCGHDSDKHQSTYYEDETYWWCEGMMKGLSDSNMYCKCDLYEPEEPDFSGHDPSIKPEWWNDERGNFCVDAPCAYPEVCDSEARGCFMRTMSEGGEEGG
jgi:protein-tyrosine phosphatase